MPSATQKPWEAHELALNGMLWRGQQDYQALQNPLTQQRLRTAIDNAKNVKKAKEVEERAKAEAAKKEEERAKKQAEDAVKAKLAKKEDTKAKTKGAQGGATADDKKAARGALSAEERAEGEKENAKKAAEAKIAAAERAQWRKKLKEHAGKEVARSEFLKPGEEGTIDDEGVFFVRGTVDKRDGLLHLDEVPDFNEKDYRKVELFILADPVRREPTEAKVLDMIPR